MRLRYALLLSCLSFSSVSFAGPQWGCTALFFGSDGKTDLSKDISPFIDGADAGPASAACKDRASKTPAVCYRIWPKEQPGVKSKLYKKDGTETSVDKCDSDCGGVPKCKTYRV